MNTSLRSIILNVQDRLSDDDRRRLHFYIGDNVPRRIREDSSFFGTLCLIQTLFERDKINEEDFTFLINAFEAIKCTDAAKILKEYKRQNESKNDVKSVYSLSIALPGKSVLSFLDDEDEVHDEIRSRNIPLEMEIPLIESTNFFRPKKKFLSKIKIHFAWLSVLLFIVLIGFVGFQSRWIIFESSIDRKETFFLQQLQQNNKTIDQMKETLAKDKLTIFKLHDEIASNAHSANRQAHWQEGTTCTCDAWCRGSGRKYGVCGDGPTCICRDQPIIKATSADGCSCDSWCRVRGHENGGVCGDGYTCICS